MKRFIIFGVLAAFLASASIGEAGLFNDFGFDTNGERINKVKLTNYETLLMAVDEDAEGAMQLQGGWFKEVAPNDLSWTALPDPGTHPDLRVSSPNNDYYAVQILRATSFNFDPDVPADERPLPPDYQMTAYSVQKFGDRFRLDDGDDTWTWNTFLPTDVDPFGIFSQSEIDGLIAAKIYMNDQLTFTSDGDGGATLADRLTNDVLNAITGEFLLSLGLGAAQDDGGAPGDASITSSPWSGTINAMGGLNLLDLGLGYESLSFPGVPNKDQFAAPTLTSFGIEARVFSNTEFSDGSPWRLKSEDPWTFRVTPEPGSLSAILGMTLFGLAGFSLRRRRRV